MHRLRKFFFLENIYHRQTFMGIGLHFIFFWIFAALILVFSDNLDTKEYEYYFLPSLYIYFLLGFYLLTRSLLRNYIVSQRTDGSFWDGTSPKSNTINESSADFELDKVDHTQNIHEEKGLIIYDAIFNFYWETKHGKELTRQAYYTTAEIDLRRKLPNLVFDSRTAKKRQFKNLFLGVQRISLEGDFNKYFDAYKPQTYHIDMLSFISPEVMEKLIDCKDYDIEIIGNKLLVFGPLLDEAGIEILYEKARALAKSIDDNIDTYKDNRLGGKDRHTDVTAFGRKLLQNPAKYYPGILLCTVLSMAIIYFGITVDQEFFINEISLAIYFSLASLIYKAAKIDIHNRKMMKQYLKK